MTNLVALNLSTGLVATGTPLALRGYDPVSYFGGKGPLAGTAEFAAVHDGATYYFADAANRDTFQASPERYLPSFGGFCAFGASVGKKFDGDPTIYKIEDGRLHLNLNQEIHRLFLADVAGAVAKADQTWPTIAQTAVSAL